MTKTIFSCLACTLVCVGAVLATGSTAVAQTAVLNEMYGRGVHQYYAGNYTKAYDLLSAAIDNGIEDPRAYYFRGIVARSTGRLEQAKGDWYAGAQLEAAGKIQGSIGRALSRYQGHGRLKLEEIRQQARLQALASGAERSRQRYGSGQRSEPADPSQQPADPQAQPAPQPQAPVTPPPTPPVAADDNPFADDAEGPAQVESEDALQDAVDSVPSEAPSEAPADGDAPAGEDDPFGGDSGDPFGGDSGDDGGGDPFGGGSGDDGGADPFGGGSGDDGGGDPFGGGSGDDGSGDDGGGDPFGGSEETEDPFG